MKKTSRERNHEEALSAFMAAIAEIRETLAQIENAVDDHLGADPEKVHWGHTGDARRILEQLRETLATARNENH